MLKNKFKIITILTILTILLTIPIVRAVESDGDITNPENTTETPTENTVTNEENPTDTTSIEDTFKRHDVYLTGDNVVIDYIIDGNLFVMADSVTIDSQIGGDAFILAKDLTISDKGYVFYNLFAAADNITINGVVYDLFSVSKNLTINGNIYRDVKASSSNISILGTVGRSAYLNFENITLTGESADENVEMAKGVITENLEYSSSKEASIPDGIVGGEVKFEPISSVNTNNNNIIINLVAFVVTVVIIWLLCSWLAPKLVKDTSLLTSKNILPIIGLGIITPIACIIAFIILLLLGITSKLALLLLAALFLLLAISTSIFIISLNNIICNKLNITKKFSALGTLIIISIALWLIGLIPIVGSIISIVAIILGLGIIMSNIIFKNKTVKE